MGSIFLNIASILSTFDVTNAVDEDGQLIIPQVKYTAGAIRLVLICVDSESC